MSAVLETLPVAQDSSPAGLLMMAVQRGADVSQLEKLMALQERWEAGQARRAFYAAKAQFQQRCPTITKDRKVEYGKTSYNYATLPGIANQIREHLSACGLTYRWEIHDAPETIQVTCILSHQDGHSESNTMSAAPDDSGAKNLIQQRGSAVTYLQRYTLIGVLGITSANDDDDGKGAGELNVERLLAHNEMVRNWLDSIACIKTCIATQQWTQAAEAWREIPHDDQRSLWLATSKGGIFTTAERKEMHEGKDFNDAMREILGSDGK